MKKFKVEIAFINEINFSFDGGDYWGCRQLMDEKTEHREYESLNAHGFNVFIGSFDFSI